MNQLESDFQMLVALLETLQLKWVKVNLYMPYYVPKQIGTHLLSYKWSSTVLNNKMNK